MKKILLHIFMCIISASLTWAEAPVQDFGNATLKTTEEDYYDFLVLQGIVERPYLNYRTLSDNRYQILSDNSSSSPLAGEVGWGGITHPWQNLNLGYPHQLFGEKNSFNSLSMQVFGPDLFMSYNTAAPYGQNDGALWQGRGFNASFTTGIRFEGWGVEATLKPQLAFSQNAAFKYMPTSSSMQGANYAGKADTYGYFWGLVDAPQRFGDKPFFTYDWGDSEVRWSPLTLISAFTNWSGWDGFDKNLTIGFGTQAVWLGPSYLNSILLSNNAPTFPKFDIGIRRQRVTIPGLGWYIGDIEFRLWTGQLSESKYFDNDSNNDKWMMNGLSLAYSFPDTFSWLDGLTFFANRISITPWDFKNLKYLFPNKYNADWTGEVSSEDQKITFGAIWVFPKIGFEVYLELGKDDYSNEIITPWHTLTYTASIKKVFNFTKGVGAELIFELSSMESSRDYLFKQQGGYTWFMHPNMMGYTNGGQWLGAGSGYGGNSQYIEFKVFYPKGTSSIFLHRDNPDNNYIWSHTVRSLGNDMAIIRQYDDSYKANVNIGITTSYNVIGNLRLSGGFIYNYIKRPYFDKWDISSAPIHNVSIQLGIKYCF
ncbi:MAG: capsule assembly Wzi family protein [Spirochaetaceae bacterium]|jgi:hypothetical protein|nr:capsule assembly Wzi family protein [Spirochaetaceae bacterium]